MELNTKLQHRMAYQESGMLLREEDGTRHLTGVAIVTNQETTLYECPDYREIEVIDPSCITPDFIKSQDIKLNLLHERNLSIARCNKGAGTLLLETREDGLHFDAPVAMCDIAERAAALVDNGTYTGCSFEFWPKDYQVIERVGQDGKTEYVIRHTAFEKVGAITLGMDPAYESTSVSLREMYTEQHPHVETEEERENREADEAAERAEQERKLRQRATAIRAREMEMMRINQN